MKKIKRESFWGSEFLSFEEKKKEIGGSESEEKAEEAETWAKFQTRRGGSHKGEMWKWGNRNIKENNMLCWVLTMHQPLW